MCQKIVYSEDTANYDHKSFDRAVATKNNKETEKRIRTGWEASNLELKPYKNI